jgi:hypothetical protein
VDIDWLKQGGGFIKNKHAPAGRFNLGEKLVYWLSLAAGVAVSVSGFLLLFPSFGTDIAEMQLAQVVHAVVAVLFVALILGHIYIGTLGMEGEFEAMGTGEVDLNWRRSITTSGLPNNSKTKAGRDSLRRRPRNKRRRATSARAQCYQFKKIGKQNLKLRRALLRDRGRSFAKDCLRQNLSRCDQTSGELKTTCERSLTSPNYGPASLALMRPSQIVNKAVTISHFCYD